MSTLSLDLIFFFFSLMFLFQISNLYFTYLIQIDMEINSFYCLQYIEFFTKIIQILSRNA